MIVDVAQPHLGCVTWQKFLSIEEMIGWLAGPSVASRVALLRRTAAPGLQTSRMAPDLIPADLSSGSRRSMAAVVTKKPSDGMCH